MAWCYFIHWFVFNVLGDMHFPAGFVVFPCSFIDLGPCNERIRMGRGWWSTRISGPTNTYHNKNEGCPFGTCYQNRQAVKRYWGYFLKKIKPKFPNYIIAKTAWTFAPPVSKVTPPAMLSKIKWENRAHLSITS